MHRVPLYQKDRRKPAKEIARVLTDFAPRLYGFLIYRLGNKEDAQDLAQEAYLRLLRVHENKIIEKPESYLFRIASNLVNEFAMQKRRTPHIVEIDSLEISDDRGDGYSLERSLEHRAAIRQLEEILEDLPPLYRAVLLLKKREGFSREEIAEKLGISVHTVKKYLARAAAYCREKWTE
ncbi:MAG: RNA polymerase subunit sigma-70 [Alphaproteobacteria bacterium]|nr:MAG: RNA polymerase subunit sigma-70 [Alphaproteobacteria bacterium]